MTSAGRTRLAVLGSPIAHSKSPALHRAAYEVLGLDWGYEAIEVDGSRLRPFVEELDAGWRGLSLTMPLKRDILPLLHSRDALTDLTGSANTVLITDAGRAGFNTDVFGIVEALRHARPPRTVSVLGAGATAASALVAVAQLGAETVQVIARSAGRAAPLIRLGAELGIDVVVPDDGVPATFSPDLVISTLPGGADAGTRFSQAVMDASTLLDVAYDPWPSALAARWLATGGHVVSGIEMLVNQALAQVRVFVGGDPTARLQDESRVYAAMRRSVGLGPSPFGDD